MSNGISYDLELCLENIQDGEIDNFCSFRKSISKLDKILEKINAEIDIGNIRKKWCKTCTNTDKGYSGCRMTACMGCALNSPFNKPLNYLGKDTDISKQTKHKLTNLIKSYNEMFKKS